MIDIEKAPTPKWMPLNWVFVLTDTANPVCRQDWHFYYLSFAFRKVSNLMRKLPKAINNVNIPRKIAKIS